MSQHIALRTPGQEASNGAPNGTQPSVRLFTSSHRVTMATYSTSVDPRGYVRVFEYLVKENEPPIMIDCETGYILFTSIWKALGHNKADVTRLVDSSPAIAPLIRRIRGGLLKIQGTWLPFETSLFGPNFPDQCFTPGMPGYGQLLLSEPQLRGRKRSVSNPQHPTPKNYNVPIQRPRAQSVDWSPQRIFAVGPNRQYRPTHSYSPYPYHAPPPEHRRQRSSEVAFVNEFPPAPVQTTHHARTPSLPSLQLPSLDFLPPLPDDETQPGNDLFQLDGLSYLDSFLPPLPTLMETTYDCAPASTVARDKKWDWTLAVFDDWPFGPTDLSALKDDQLVATDPGLSPGIIPMRAPTAVHPQKDAVEFLEEQSHFKLSSGANEPPSFLSTPRGFNNADLGPSCQALAALTASQPVLDVSMISGGRSHAQDQS